MKASAGNAWHASRAAALAGGAVAALVAVASIAIVGIGNATAAPQVTQGSGAGVAVTRAASVTGACLQSAYAGFQDADGDGVCDNLAARQSAAAAAGPQQNASASEAAQPAGQATQSGAAATGICRNDVDGDGICDICGSATPASCTGLHHHYGYGDGAGSGSDNGSAAFGSGCGYGHHCGHHAYRHGC